MYRVVTNTYRNFKKAAAQLIFDLSLPDVLVVCTLCMRGRNGHPGLVNIEFGTANDKVMVL